MAASGIGDWLSAFIGLILSYGSRQPGFEAGMDVEFRFHIAKRIEDLIRGGSLLLVLVA